MKWGTNSIIEIERRVLDTINVDWQTLGAVHQAVNNTSQTDVEVPFESVAFVCGYLYRKSKIEFKNCLTEDNKVVKYFLVRKGL